MAKTLSVKDNVNFEVSGIGSALLDFTVEVEDAVLDSFGLTKGTMQLITEEQSKDILGKLNNYKMETSPGGSSANTIAGVANFGGKAAFMGTVGSDDFGETYIIATEKHGVTAKINKHNRMTGHAITFITPDKERSFATHLGAAIDFNAPDINEDVIKDSKIIHFEGYLFEPDNLREACLHAMKIAKENQTIVSIDMSDPALVKRIESVFNTVLPEYADIIFANEEEAMAFSGKDEAGALDVLYTLCDFAVVKLGARGSMIKYQDQVSIINPFEAKLVNTNGAGDMYASGVLYGLSQGLSAEECGKYGSYASSLVVAQSAARLRNSIDITKI